MLRRYFEPKTIIIVVLLVCTYTFGSAQRQTFDGDSLMITLLKKSIAAPLILQGNAIIWKRKDLRQLFKIEVERGATDDNFIFYFEKSNDSFFEGGLLHPQDSVHKTPSDSVSYFDQYQPVLTEKETDPNAVFMIVDQMPDYPGGLNALSKYVWNNISVPKSKRQGTHSASLVVEPNGTVSNVKIMRGSTPDVNKALVSLRKNYGLDSRKTKWQGC
jgi:hypothetical protein